MKESTKRDFHFDTHEKCLSKLNELSVTLPNIVRQYVTGYGGEPGYYSILLGEHDLTVLADNQNGDELRVALFKEAERICKN